MSKPGIGNTLTQPISGLSNFACEKVESTTECGGGNCGSTFKRPQPTSSPECSPRGGGNIGENYFRQSAPLRRKCEEINGNMNGVNDREDREEEKREACFFECIRQDNGIVAVLQAPRCAQVESFEVFFMYTNIPL